MAKTKQIEINNLVVTADEHAGCQLGLCPARGVRLDEGGRYKPNKLQRGVWRHWKYFWSTWIPKIVHGEPFGVVNNGDAIDGSHHGTVTQITQNLEDQVDIAYEILAPIVELCDGRYWHIRGTEAHGGKSGQQEEELAKRLGAIPCPQTGQFARYHLLKRVGTGLTHISHHIGSTSSAAYEATAPMRELHTAFADAGRWGYSAPDVIARSHRHRNIEVRMAARTSEGPTGYAAVFTTPGWQGKTPLVWRSMEGRLSEPQFGGAIIRQGDEDLHTRHYVEPLKRPPIE